MSRWKVNRTETPISDVSVIQVGETHPASLSTVRNRWEWFCVIEVTGVVHISRGWGALWGQLRRQAPPPRV